MAGLFIAGTDTGVGKTLVTALLAAAAQANGASVCVYKPLQTGAERDDQSDPAQINRWLKRPVATAIGYRFAPPVAPWVADVRREISLDAMRATARDLLARYDLTLIEGVGGVRVPLAPGLEVLDLMAALALPVVMVARPDLGTINHTLLTAQAVRDRGLDLRGAIVSRFDAASPDPAVRALPEALAAFLPEPVLAWIPPLALTEPLDEGTSGAVAALTPLARSLLAESDERAPKERNREAAP